jgi:glucose/arabinose dehydrogenase
MALMALSSCTAEPEASPGGEPSPVPSPTATGAPTASPPAPTPTPASSPLASPPATGPSATDPSPTQPSPAATPPTSFDAARVELELEEYVSGLSALTFLTHAGDGSGVLYAVEQRGLVVAIEPGGAVREQPLLDIRDRVRDGGEQGLLGLAFHPDYDLTGRIFVDYTDLNGDTVVSEFAVDGQSADPASERIVLQIDQPFGNHNGGMVAFGPDGYLYISTGDGGGAGDPLEAGQDLGSLLGAILRIDVDGAEPYAIPPDNPHVGASGARPEIWARGLRNPWRFSFDRQTGDLFIADVGQNRWEEINAEPAGEGGRNYGWNVMEGPECFAVEDCDTSGLTSPVAWYPLDAGNCAVTGGYVYRGEEHPVLAGGYLFADFCAGRVWALDAGLALEAGEAPMTQLLESGFDPSTFGEDEAGELYLGGQGGQILRLTASER